MNEINGVICINKPQDFTSFDVVAIMRRAAGTRKIGHGGTLDPMATGVLPIYIGRAAKTADLNPVSDKKYRAAFRLGITTDTEDVWGKVLTENNKTVILSEMTEAVKSMQGDIMQTPPMYSAVKVNGKRLYDLARQGIEIERAARPVTVYSIGLSDYDTEKRTGILDIHCSKGTYIRTLCNDIGERLGCHGCMKSLLRVRVAGFDLEHALTLSQIQSKVDEGCFDMVMPVDGVFENLPAVHTASDADKLVRNGNKIPAVLTDYLKHSADSDIRYRVYNHEGIFVGVYSYLDETGEFKPVKIFME